MKVPVAYIWYDECQNAPSTPMVAWVDMDNLVESIANIIMRRGQTTRVLGPHTIDITTPKDPTDPESVGPTTETVELQVENYYGDIAIHFDGGTHFFLSFPLADRVDCLKTIFG